MTGLSADLEGEIAALLWPAFVVFLRVGAMVSLVPAFGERSVPVRVRLALAVGFTLIVLPAVISLIDPVPPGFGTALLIGGAEVLSGLLLGLLLRLFVLALQMAGTIAAQATTLAQIFGGGPGGEPQPAIGNVLVVGGLALAALSGLHVQLAAYMIDGYRLLPPGVAPGPSIVAEAGLAGVSQSFSLAFALAAPFVVASLAYNVMIGVINRAMPQLMVAFVGAPAITAAGLLLLMLSAPRLLDVWLRALEGFMAMPFGGAP